MTSLTTLKSMSSVNRAEVIAAEATSRPLGTNAYMNTHTRTRTFTHDAGRQVAPLVLLSTQMCCLQGRRHRDFFDWGPLFQPTFRRLPTEINSNALKCLVCKSVAFEINPNSFTNLLFARASPSVIFRLGSCISIIFPDYQPAPTQMHSQMCCLQGRRYRVFGIGIVCFKQLCLRLPTEITNSFPNVLLARASLSRFC